MATAAARATVRRRRGPGPPVVATLRNRTPLTIELLANGSILAIRHGDILVNQVLGSQVEGGLGNVYLRRRRRAGMSFVPLIGPSSDSRFRVSGAGAAWEGSVDGVDYTCTLRLDPRRPTWFWTVAMTNRTRRRVSLDAVLSQDLGIAAEAAVRTSELYTSQYIDHTILEDEALGYLVCSRQNLPQAGAFPWMMHGCLNGAAGFLTDGFQLLGLGYRASNVPAALGRRSLPNQTSQYELAQPTLQSRVLALAPGESGEITFFAAFVADHPTATSRADAVRAREAARTFRGRRRAPVGTSALARPAGVFDRPILFASRDLGQADLERFFGAAWRHVERHDGRLLSFFHGYQQHVVLRAKELVVERPTGHILRSGRGLLPSDDTMAVTAWMCGVFASQLTIGNTSFNKVLSVARSPLNVLKSGGQRIFVATERGLELLGLPSAFEMGPNSARWIYDDDRHTLAIKVTTSLEAPVCRLDIEVVRGGPVALLVTSDVVLGEHEGGPAARVVTDLAAARVELRPAVESPLLDHYPEATFFIVSPHADRVEAIGRDGLLNATGEGPDGSHVAVRTKPVTRFSLFVTGSILDAGRAAELATARGLEPDPEPSVGRETAPGRETDPERAATAFWSGLARHATLGGATGRCAGDLARLDDVLRWYVVDAMVHGTIPHGLEQSGGAAWAVRDVCQGPVELLVATGNTEPVRELLGIVYAEQDRRTGDWPQWFMFDRYREIRAPDSHADIVYWPMKALCDYAEATGDLSILDILVPYAGDTFGDGDVTSETILAHAGRQVARIESDCIAGTSLPVFAGGDWEDTLQPADPAMAPRLVSAWTVELAWQTLDRFRRICGRAGADAMAERLAGLCDRLRSDFNRHLVPDGVVTGLADFGPDGIEYLLHPRDRRTGVSCRLLPMTRGMTSGLFTAEQASRHAALIERHLTFPDGVRLMDRPMTYNGGPSRLFRRAESAAAFGREVGLQYVHAHIRYIEAMARIGRPDEAFRGLLAVCPIGLELDVPSALPRQANAYFSSSDAAFPDRRRASRQFDRVRTGRVGVRGGWRIYSSGPGIFVNQLISNVLGLRGWFDDVLFDPVLPLRADGLTFDVEYQGRPVRYLYHVTGRGYSPREVRVNGRSLPGGRYSDNPYRPGGLLIPKAAFLEALDRDTNLVEIDV